MAFKLGDIGAVFTCCLFPEFTLRAMESVLGQYPMLQVVVVDDHCREHETDLQAIKDGFGVGIIRNPKRIGTGRSIDGAIRALQTPLLLTVDHGIEIKKPGLLESYLEGMNEHPEWIGVGPYRNDKKCNHAFGPYVDPVFSLWDSRFILVHQDNGCTFALTNVRIGSWQVSGCSTAQFMQYRAMRLGKTQGFVRKAQFTTHMRHHMTPHTRGRCASPHELVVCDEDFLSPRLRAPNGSLKFRGVKWDPRRDGLDKRPGHIDFRGRK